MNNIIRIVKKGKHKGYTIKIENVYRDLFYLLTIFLSDEKIAKTFRSNKDQLHKICGVNDDEIARLVINCATTARIIMDQKKKNTNGTHSVGIWIENTKKPNKIKKLSIREACNKIIHAKELQFEVKKVKKDIYSLKPKLILIGDYNDQTWEVEINIIEFIRKYIQFIK